MLSLFLSLSLSGGLSHLFWGNQGDIVPGKGVAFRKQPRVLCSLFADSLAHNRCTKLENSAYVQQQLFTRASSPTMSLEVRSSVHRQAYIQYELFELSVQ